MKKRNKYLGATIATVAVMSVASVASVASAASYTDVPNDHFFAQEIALVSEMNLMKGYPDGSFKPAANITRGELATIIHRAAGSIPASGVNHFTDVKQGEFYSNAVNFLADLGIANGYPDKTFKPNQFVTREEAAKLIALSLQLPLDENAQFTDVPPTNIYTKYIQALVEAGLVNGTSETTFSPKDNIKREQAAAILARSVDAPLPADPVEGFELSIAHVNDTHARVEEMPKLATAIQAFRADNPNALVLHAGDVFSGTLYFNTFLGQADLEMMNYIGFDAMTLGNHEFDLGSSEDGHSALADFISGANFSVLSANIDASADPDLGPLQNKEYTEDFLDGELYDGIIKEVNGEKIGIFGLTTEETESIASPGDVVFTDYIEAAEEAVAAFEAKGVNKIIALTHIGYDDAAAVDNDLTLAAAVDGIDIIVGGHTHTRLNAPVEVTEDAEGNEKDVTIIVQAYQYAEVLGTVDVVFNDEGVIIDYTGELQDVSGLTPDPGAVDILNEYKPQIDELMTQEIGLVLEEALENPRTSDEGNTAGISVRKNETILGNIITDGMRAKAQQFTDKEVVMAFQNGGGIRAAIPAGPVTSGEVIAVLPFGNTLALIDVTGEELIAAFEHSVSQFPGESGGFLHVSGAVITFDSTAAVGSRIVSIELVDEEGNVTEIDSEATYTVATNFFTAQGGDGYTMFADAYADGRVQDLGLSDWENLAEHLTSEGFVVPTTLEGRINDIGALLTTQ